MIFYWPILCTLIFPNHMIAYKPPILELLRCMEIKPYNFPRIRRYLKRIQLSFYLSDWLRWIKKLLYCTLQSVVSQGVLINPDGTPLNLCIVRNAPKIDAFEITYCFNFQWLSTKLSAKLRKRLIKKLKWVKSTNLGPWQFDAAS